MRTRVVGKENLETVSVWRVKKMEKKHSDCGSTEKKTNLVIVENKTNKCRLDVGRN